MNVPQEVMKYIDEKYAYSELSCLGHLLNLEDQTLRFFLLVHFNNPDEVKTSTLTSEQILEANAILLEVQQLWAECHDYVWMSQVVFTTLPGCRLNFYVPDEHAHLMLEVIECMKTANIKNIPETQPTLN